MARENGIIDAIDNAIKQPDTPEWGRVLLLCVRDDHVLLRNHLRESEQSKENTRGIALKVASAVAIAAVMYALSCIIPTVFTP